MIPLAEPRFDGNEARYLLECVDTGYVSSIGAFVDRFEQEFAAYVGAAHAVACASGTAALHVALRLAGAGPGRLVAVSDFTFIASANAATYTGADLLLVDSAPDTWNMDTELLYDEVARRARFGGRLPDVVEIVHVLGHPADLGPLLALRDEFGIRVVEDAAEALGASWCAGDLAGRQAGTVGDIGCFSFNGNKIITSGGGGMIVTDDAGVAARARHLTTQAKLPGDYRHDTVGYNYRLTNIAAAVGLAQLERLPGLLRAKREIAARYAASLATADVTTAPCATWASPSYWLYSVLLENASPAAVVADLDDRAIRARRLWPPLHCQRPYDRTERLGDDTAVVLHRHGLSLPSSAHLTQADQHTVVAALIDVLGRRQS